MFYEPASENIMSYAGDESAPWLLSLGHSPTKKILNWHLCSEKQAVDISKLKLILQKNFQSEEFIHIVCSRHQADV
jgi:hypothetical protein